jgi:hypothetical protein
MGCAGHGEKARTVTVTVCRSAVEKQLQPHAPRQVPTKYVDTFLNILWAGWRGNMEKKSYLYPYYNQLFHYYEKRK